jgi:hypothetical protein
MDPVTIAMLGLGAANMVSNMSKEQRQRKLAAETQRYSPWTNLRANQVEEANPAGDLAQTGASILGYQQAQEAADLRKQLTQAQIAALGRGTLQSTSSPMLAQQRNPWSNVYGSPLGTPYGYME